MKEKWLAPKTVIEEFTPNEYIAACWGVGCDTSAANKYEYEHHNLALHLAGRCGKTDHQYLKDENNDGIPEDMFENAEHLGGKQLKCTIYSDADYTNTISASMVRTGSKIYWITTTNFITYHHQGTVFNTVEGHPNASF